MSETLTDLKRIRPGDFVCLTDEVTIKDLMEKGAENATDGLQLEIERVYHIRENDGLCDWYLCPLKDGPDGLHLFIKAVDDVYDVRVYWIPEDFANTRTVGDLIKDNVFHLFDEPKDPDNFKPCDLEYSGWIDLGKIKYDVKGGALHGECRETPVPSGLKQPQFATVVEYATADESAEDSEILIVEIGGLDDEGNSVSDGGVVHYFHGGPVNDSDINLIQQ